MRARIIKAAATTNLVLLLAACGSSGGSTSAAPTGAASSNGARVVNIDMRDISYSTNALTVRSGETIEFRFHNTGTVDHEALLGDDAAQSQHEADMTSHSMPANGSMDSTSSPMGMGASSDLVTVAPGNTASITHMFRAGETLIIGCHEPGHYGAGMKLTISVA